MTDKFLPTIISYYHHLADQSITDYNMSMIRRRSRRRRNQKSMALLADDLLAAAAKEVTLVMKVHLETSPFGRWWK